jgi:vacuolar-type H+-ATPase subunit I/STV1
MGRVGCKVCEHNDIKAINKAIIAGESLRKIAEKYDFHYSTLCRHKQHLADKIHTADVLADAKEGASVLQQIDALLQRANDLLDKAEDSGDLRVAVSAVREVRGTLELLAKASGELSPERLLVQVAPVIDQLTMILKQEIGDQETIERIAEKIKDINI